MACKMERATRVACGARPIPLAARAFAVVDVWDVLRSDRPYRPAWPEERVRAHMRGLAGTHFEPHILEAFLTHVDGECDRPSTRGGQ